MSVTASLKLFDGSAGTTNSGDVVRLTPFVAAQYPSPIAHLHEKLPNKAKLDRTFNPYGKVLEFTDDCIVPAG